VDFDFYEPIRLVLELLNERMPSGAIIIVDDYDFSRVAPHDGPTTTNSSGQFRSLIAARTAEKFLYYDRSPTKSAKRLAVVA
jgi:hypothetical protein